MSVKADVIFSNEGKVALQLAQDHMNWSISPLFIQLYRIVLIFAHFKQQSNLHPEQDILSFTIALHF